MYKMFKWIYKLGVMHERRRVKLLIAEYVREKPEPYGYEEDDAQYKKNLELWHSVNSTLQRLLEPSYENYVTTAKTPLDDTEEL